MTPVAGLPGVVVLAAHRPRPELLRAQLESIRDQTRRDWRCLVGADGDEAAVRRLVAEIVGDDDRFEVVGWGDNLGFYRNFERLLAAVPSDVGWVALSDQDDRWLPDKLERLVPLLDEVSLASGQARLVAWPKGRVIGATTCRRVVAPGELLLMNQVTGAFSVLRRDLLDLALPFPRLDTVTQVHDHWLAMCAVVTGGYTVLDEVVQDYVQHGANLVGEDVSGIGLGPVGVLKLVHSTTVRHRHGRGPRAVLVAGYELSFGWRRLMATELSVRGRPGPLRTADGRDVGALLRSGTRSGCVRVLAEAVRSADVSTRSCATFCLGLPRALLGSS